MFNWDHKRLVILEATNSDVFHDLQAKGILDWVYLVAAGMAVVSPRGYITCLADLEKLKTHCEDHNNQFGKKKANMGAYYAERIVLSKRLMEEPEIKAKLGDNQNRVFWDRNFSKDGKDLLRDNKTCSAMTSQEVVVTLNNWHFMSNKELTLHNLTHVVTPYLVTMCRSKGVLAQLNFKWASTSQANTWKLFTNNDEAAKVICTSIIDVHVSQQDTMANLNFKSHLHKLGQTDLQQYFGNLAITDVHDEFATQGLASAEGGNVHRWDAGSTTGSWCPIACAQEPQEPQGPQEHQVPQEHQDHHEP
jgi:hypothetical protein